jgi:hypothetical protein
MFAVAFRRPEHAVYCMDVRERLAARRWVVPQVGVT